MFELSIVKSAVPKKVFHLCGKCVCDFQVYESRQKFLHICCTAINQKLDFEMEHSFENDENINFTRIPFFFSEMPKLGASMCFAVDTKLNVFCRSISCSLSSSAGFTGTQRSFSWCWFKCSRKQNRRSHQMHTTFCL